MRAEGLGPRLRGDKGGSEKVNSCRADGAQNCKSDMPERVFWRGGSGSALLGGFWCGRFWHNLFVCLINNFADNSIVPGLRGRRRKEMVRQKADA
jgi:hypothetical protein